MVVVKLILGILLFAQISFAGGDPASAILSRQGDTQFTSKPTQPAIYDSAAKVQKENKKGQQQAQMISTALNQAGQSIISACCGNESCSSQCPVGIGLVVMGGLASLQAAGEGKTAGQAGRTMSATNALSNYNNGKMIDAPGNGENSSGFSQIGSDLAKSFANKKIPVTFDGKKLVGPDGKKIGPDDVASPSSMAAAGLSKDQIASISGELSKASKAAEEKYKLTTPNFGFSEGGGGGGGAYGKAPAGNQSTDEASYGAGQRGISAINSKEATSGLTKNYHGDPIGVSNDSIFNMMTRRYQLKERQDSFFGQSNAAVQK